MILPVDDQAIQRLFEARYGTTDAADSFLSKTFDASFTVPDPVMSDWRAFLAEQLRHAFGSEINDHQIFAVRRFLENDLKARNRSIKKETAKSLTPREINRFINSVVSLYLQWRGLGIDLVSLAYFSIFRQHIQTDVMKFVLSGAPALAKLDSDWQVKIAAMHFGVTLDKAAQVLIEEPLIEAISSCDEAAFSEYAAIPGFGEVFADLTAQSGGLVEGDSEAAWSNLNAAELLAGLENFAETVWVAIAWENLGHRIGETIGNLEPSPELVDRLKRVLPHLSSSAIQAIGDGTSIALSTSLATAEGLENVDVVSELVGTLVEACEHSEITYPNLMVPTTPDQFLRVLVGFQPHDQVIERLTLNAPESFDTLSEEFIELSNDAATAESLPWLIRTLANDERRRKLGIGAVDWKPLIAHLESVGADSSAPLASKGRILEVIGALTAVDENAIAVAQQGANQGWIASQLDEALAKGNEKAVASGYAVLIWRNKEIPHPEGLWRTHLSRYPNIVSDTIFILRKLNDNVSIEPIANHYAEYHRTRDLLTALLTSQVEMEDLGSIFPDRIANDFYRYSRILPYRLRDDFIELLLNYEDFEATLRTAPWGEGLDSVALHLLDQGDQKATEVRSIIMERLVASDGEDIRSTVEQGEEPLSLILALHQRNRLSFLAESGPYRMLEYHLDALPSASSDFVKRWFDLLDTLASGPRRELLNRLAEALLASKDCESLSQILGNGGRPLFDSVPFSADPDAAIEKVVLPVMKKQDGREVLRKHKGVVARWIAKAGKRTKTRLRSRVQTMKTSTFKHRAAFGRAVSNTWLKD